MRTQATRADFRENRMSDLPQAIDHRRALRTLQVSGSLASLPEMTRPLAGSLNLNIASDDEMYDGNDGHYLACGASALNLIFAASQLAQVSPRAILDFGAGAGRVLRWLRAAFPTAHLGAADLREQDMAFCREQFQAEAWKSGTDIAALEAPSTYDLIWVSSVLTHLSAENCGRLVDKLMSWTNPGGLLIMSTHGRTALLPHNHEDGYTLEPEVWRDVQSQHAACGFGYADYPDEAGYGVSLTKLSWWGALVERMPCARMVLLSEGLLGAHQDVVAIQKVEVTDRACAPHSAEEIARDLVSREGMSVETPTPLATLKSLIQSSIKSALKGATRKGPR
jgi:SAM-dependent methyltransferase